MCIFKFWNTVYDYLFVAVVLLLYDIDPFRLVFFVVKNSTGLKISAAVAIDIWFSGSDIFCFRYMLAGFNLFFS